MSRTFAVSQVTREDDLQWNHSNTSVKYTIDQNTNTCTDYNEGLISLRSSGNARAKTSAQQIAWHQSGNLGSSFG